MKSAYLYCRVSTDEQKRKGYSLVEQEDRLMKHCEMHGIRVKGIYREDYSAKNFNRPEWKKLIKKIRRGRYRSPEIILFIKWGRFSRSIEYAYQTIPEYIIMPAVYVSRTRSGKYEMPINYFKRHEKSKKNGAVTRESACSVYKTIRY